MKRFGMFLVVVLALSACGKGGKKVGGVVVVPAAVNSGIHGTWLGLPDEPTSSGTARKKLRLQPATVSNIVTCEFSDTIITAMVTVTATYAGNFVTVLSGSKSETFNGKVCTAMISGGTFTAQMSGDRLLFGTGARTHLLTRE